MKWQDNGIILSQRPWNDNEIILNILTQEHGRHAGLVRVSRQKQNLSHTQPGNLVEVTWNARLSEHLGRWTLDVGLMPWFQVFKNPARLLALSTACALADSCLPERHPYLSLYMALKDFLYTLVHDQDWPRQYMKFEISLLSELGFGLNLDFCAVTKTTDNLAFVSPKTGHAVCAEVGKMYEGKLLPLPHFLIQEGKDYTQEELAQAFYLTGYFISRNLLEGKALPEIRRRFIDGIVCSERTKVAS